MSTGYNLSLNKKYLISTLGGTIINEQVKVTGIISYEEAKKTTSDVRITGINEKVVGITDWDTYFANLEYYKCETIGSNPGRTIVVWAEILNPLKSNILSEAYTYEVSLTIPVTTSGTSVDVNTLRDSIVNFALERGVTLTFKVIEGDTNVEIDSLRKKLDECESVLRGLQGLNVVLPTIERIATDDLSKKIDTIYSQLQIVVDKMTTIATQL